jgi:hypothetical protein
MPELDGHFVLQNTVRAERIGQEVSSSHSSEVLANWQLKSIKSGRNRQYVNSIEFRPPINFRRSMKSLKSNSRTSSEKGPVMSTEAAYIDFMVQWLCVSMTPQAERKPDTDRSFMRKEGTVAIWTVFVFITETKYWKTLTVCGVVKKTPLVPKLQFLPTSIVSFFRKRAKPTSIDANHGNQN